MSREEMLQRFERNWAESISKAAGDKPPATKEWRGVNEIAHVLSAFAGQNKNHAHLPTGGGNDVLAVERSETERDCLELKIADRMVYLVKPERLEFVHIPESPHDSFLLLHLAELKPTGVYEEVENQEELLELRPGEYVDRGVWDAGFIEYDEEGREVPLPKTARLVVRWLGGKMLFVAKGSYWNGQSRTYDGRHNRMTADEIREMISRRAA